VIVLHPEQEAEVRLLAADLDLSTDLVVQMLLSGPLSRHLGETVVTSPVVPA
jgi:cyanate lyase